MRFTRLLGLLLAALLLALSACGGSGGGDDTEASQESPSESPSEEQSQDPAAAEPDLDGIPDVVAEVNGEEIGKDAFVDAYTAQFQQATMQGQGQAPDQEQLRKQVVDNLVSTELLVQEADQRGFTATRKQTRVSLQQVAEQNGLKTAAELVKALKKQGLDRAAIETQVRNQVQIEQLLDDVGGDTKPSEKELRALYQSVKEQQSGKVPPFKKVRPQLVQQLTSQKQSQVVSTLVADLRKKAEITVNI